VSPVGGLSPEELPPDEPINLIIHIIKYNSPGAPKSGGGITGTSGGFIPNSQDMTVKAEKKRYKLLKFEPTINI